jgi:hypothetical protein
MEAKMNLKNLKDQELLCRIKNLVRNERELLTQILHHLREVEIRKLFSELGYQSLFDYAVKELKYSHGQAGRRIQALRLLKELPHIENKIQTGALSLTNISQAQTYFREKDRASKANGNTHSPLNKAEKMEILESLENKSSREGEKIILALRPANSIPPERQRPITDTLTEFRFVMDESLNEKLEELRSLLGPKSLSMNFADLIHHMAEIAVKELKIKKFGKNRASSPEVNFTKSPTSPIAKTDSSTPTAEPTPAPELRHSKSIPRQVKYQIWTRDRGICSNCGSRTNLNIDHIHPKSLGGDNSPENLRILCFHCNQRRALKTFGIRSRER